MKTTTDVTKENGFACCKDFQTWGVLRGLGDQRIEQVGPGKSHTKFCAMDLRSLAEKQLHA